jgi:lysophospholipase L1-like esterase
MWKYIFNIFFFVATVFVFVFCDISSANSDCRTDQIRIVCIGDSHFAPRSGLVRYMQAELGDGYDVVAAGRKGWTTRRWLSNRNTWRRLTRDADFIFVSLGGNDRARRVPESEIDRNLDQLFDLIPENVGYIRIIRPNNFMPPLDLAGDGIHLSRDGARTYAHILIQQYFEANNGC